MKLRNKKTGEVFDALIREKGGGGSYSLIICDIKAYEQSKSTLDATHFVLDEYESLTELNEEWEDYKPDEPLIKDEKVRKAVRAWAVLNGTYPIYFEDGYTLSYNHAPRIEFENRVFTNLDGRPYTIAELCGEEE